jgi:hypothetical protein
MGVVSIHGVDGLGKLDMISLVDAYCICPQIRDVVSQSLSACELDLVEALLVSSDTLLEILVCGFGIGLKPSVGENGIRWYVAQVLLKLERVAVKKPHYIHGPRSTGTDVSRLGFYWEVGVVMPLPGRSSILDVHLIMDKLYWVSGFSDIGYEHNG